MGDSGDLIEQVIKEIDFRILSDYVGAQNDAYRLDLEKSGVYPIEHRRVSSPLTSQWDPTTLSAEESKKYNDIRKELSKKSEVRYKAVEKLIKSEARKIAEKKGLHHMREFGAQPAGEKPHPPASEEVQIEYAANILHPLVMERIKKMPQEKFIKELEEDAKMITKRLDASYQKALKEDPQDPKQKATRQFYIDVIENAQKESKYSENRATAIAEMLKENIEKIRGLKRPDAPKKPPVSMPPLMRLPTSAEELSHMIAQANNLQDLEPDLKAQLPKTSPSGTREL